LIMLPIAAWVKILRSHLIFCATVIGPIGFGLILVWGVVVGAPPLQNLHSNPLGGAMYAAIVLTRLLVISALMQITLLSLTTSELMTTVYALGIRGELFFIILGANATLPDIRSRVFQIYDACKARGLMGNLSLLDRTKAVPYILRGTFAWTIRSSIQRADIWHQRNILRDDGQWAWKGEREPVLEIATVGSAFLLLAASWYVRYFR
ncbi:MAG: energy-coupling factor transporter transmembrane component T family protein, partial [Sulfobacillus sp.]